MEIEALEAILMDEFKGLYSCYDFLFFAFFPTFMPLHLNPII